MPKKSMHEDCLKRLSVFETSDLSNFSQVFVYLLETTTDFLYFKDKNHRFTAASQAFADLTGHRCWQDLIGKHDLEIFPKHHAQRYYESELPVMNEGKELKNRREPYVTLEGEPGWVSTNKWPIKDKDNKIIGLFGISRDVTELVRAEEKIQKSEENFRLLFEHSSMGIAIHEFVYDSNGIPEDYIIRNVNPAYSSHSFFKNASRQGIAGGKSINHARDGNFMKPMNCSVFNGMVLAWTLAVRCRMRQ